MSRVLRKIKLNKKNKATTLIEMIVVMTIFSVVGVAIATSFMSGMRIWGRVNNRDFKHNFILLEIEDIARAVRQKLEIPDVYCFGTVREFSFLTVKRDRILRQTYLFDADNQKLLFTEEALADILAKQETSLDLAREILKATDLTFQYFLYDSEKKQYVWADAWKSDENVLAGVQIKLKFKNDEIKKTIFLQKI